MHSHIPVALLWWTLSVGLKILLIYYVFVHVWVLGSFVLETIPHLATLLECVVRYQVGVLPCTALTPELWNIQLPCWWGPLPLGATQCVKAILKEGQFLNPRPASTELVSTN